MEFSKQVRVKAGDTTGRACVGKAVQRQSTAACDVWAHNLILTDCSWLQVVNGLCGGPLLGMFLLGMLTRTAEERGAFCGVVAGSLALLVVMAAGRLCTEDECVAGCCETWLGWLGRVAFFWCKLTSHLPMPVIYGWVQTDRLLGTDAGIGASVCFLVGYCRSWLHHGGHPDAASQRKIEGLVYGFGTTRAVENADDGEQQGLPMRAAGGGRRRTGGGGNVGEKQRLVGGDAE